MRSAPAQIAIERIRTSDSVGWGLQVEQRLGLHDHASDAIAALGGLLIDEGLLQLVRLAVLHQPGQGRHRPADGGLGSRHT